MTVKKNYTYKITRRQVQDTSVTVQVTAAEWQRLRALTVREREALWQGLTALPDCQSQQRTYTKWLGQNQKITEPRRTK